MAAEERKAMVRRAIDEAMNRGNVAIMDEMISPNYVFHGADGSELRGIPAYKEFISMVRGAFPDIHYDVEDIACEGDTVAVRASLTGTNTAAWRGIPPTGKKVAMQEAIFFRFDGDKPVEEWQFINQLVMLQQLGIFPSPPKPGS